MPVVASLLAQLQAIVGAEHILTTGDLSAYNADWRKRKIGQAAAVVLPASTQAVAEVVKACAAHSTPMVVQGGNTGLVLGGVPDDSGREVVLSLRRMRRVRTVDSANLSLTAEAGCVLQNVQEAAAEQGLLFPLSLAAQGTCTIGGNLATNAGGTQVLRYGCARDLCLGLEVVTAQGAVYQNLSGLRKDNTGYDLRHLFIGSEGTLGIITAATLKLYAMPQTRLCAWLALPNPQAALDALGLAQVRLGASLTGFEVMHHFALTLVKHHFAQHSIPLWQDQGGPPWFALLESSSNDDPVFAQVRFEGLLEALLEKEVAGNAMLAQNLAQAQHLWRLRESIPLAQSLEGLNVKHDISIPVSSIPDFIQTTDALLLRRFSGVRFVNYGHWGDGNLHYNVQCPVAGDPRQFLAQHETAIHHRVYEQVARFGGSISAEHGIGALKRDALAEYKDATALALMRRIKKALDPDNLLNPGRVL